MAGNASSFGYETHVSSWQSSPNSRGSFDIIWSCFKTIALCAWVSVCINVPTSERRFGEHIRDKFHFVLLTLSGPELIFMLAFGQYLSARRSVDCFAKLGYKEWTLTHAFYADMGGIVIQPRGWKAFPINAEQVFYLVNRGYMRLPQLSQEQIRNRAKSDRLARFICVVQTIYFTITTVARAHQGLAISTIELTVLGFIFCSLATTICWWRKPADVEEPHTFELDVSLETILRQAGSCAEELYHDTPLDFVCVKQKWVVSLLWQYYVNILRRLHIFAGRHKARPLQKISSFNFPSLGSLRAEMITGVVSIAYTSTFVCAWSFHFPSTLERDLWRIVSVTQIALCFCAGFFELVFHNRASIGVSNTQEKTAGYNYASDVEPGIHGTRVRGATHKLWSMPCNNDVLRLPSRTVPMRSLIVTTPIAALYVVCRWYLLVEDLLGLRSLPASAFVTVNWTEYWPSF